MDTNHNKNSGIILITKDALFREYLPTYGNKYWTTPNIDELAEKGTVFNRYYTGAPSTVMSNMCMFTGKYPHESELGEYGISNLKYTGETLFDTAERLGYEPHIIWDEAWTTEFRMEEKYYCYGANTIFHRIPEFRQGVGAHYNHKGTLVRDDRKTICVYEKLTHTFETILEQNHSVFVWLHVPHVINGRTGYGQDIDVYDQIVGIARRFFQDENIFISADHGNMNGEKGKLQYGHDVYEAAIKIPLITPRLENQSICQELCSNVNLSDILFNRKIPKKDLIYSDSAFFAQPNRKLAIVTQNYKYIYNKFDNTEELYDLRFDEKENGNLTQGMVYDPDRHCASPFRELFFYPYWNEIDDVLTFFRAERERIWKNADPKTEFLMKCKQYYKLNIYGVFRAWLLKKKSKRCG